MAAALLGKCIGLLALVLLFYSCCHAFRIREHGAQTASSSAEEPHRASCTSIFSRCQEKTTASTGRKWHETTATRLASARKPPAEVTSSEHEDAGAEGVGASLDRSGLSTGDDDEDDEEVIVEVEQDSDEGVLEDSQVDDAEEQEDDDDSGNDEAEGDDEDDEDDEEDEEDRSEKDREDEEERRKKKRRSSKRSAEDEDERKDETMKDSRKKEIKFVTKKEDTRSKVTRIKDTRKAVSEEEEVEEEESSKRAVGIERGSKETVKSSKKKGDSGEEDAEVDDESEDNGDEEDENDEEDEDKDDEDDEDKDDDDDEEEDEDEDSEEVPTPAPRKLEKVHYADKDKVRSMEVESSRAAPEKQKVEAKKPEPVKKQDETKKAEPAKKQEETKKAEPVKKQDETKKAEPVRKQEETKKVVEAAKKPADTAKKPMDGAKKISESPAKSAEGPKKVEPVRATKSEPELHKAKSAPKPEQAASVPVKSEVSKVSQKTKPEQPKQPEKTKVKTVQATSAKAEVKRSDKEEGNSKAKTKAHVEASFTLAQLNDALLHVPTFVPNFTAVEDFECQQHGKIFLRQLRGYKLWALQMMDSSAKIPSGLLRGNVNQLGDFDECLGVVAYVKLNDNTLKVQGKYCLASIDLYASHPDMKLPVHMMQSRAFMRGNMHDPGHFVPKFTTMNWALCIPAACSAEDAENILVQALNYYNSTTGIKFTVNVDPDMCYVKQASRSYSKETIGVLYFYAMIICLVIVATVRDYLVVSERKGNYSERIIMSFSLRRTVRSLMKKGSAKHDIECIHGIRTLITILLYLGHKILPITRIPYANRIDINEVANSPMSVFLRTAFVYTEAFLLLSGVLTAYNMANEYTIRGEMRWFCRFITRYIRLTPALLAVVFWYAFVMEHTGSGPQWNSIILPNAELCKRNAWTNLLYIQNFFPFEEMCATHTHQLALDMQLSLLAPILVFFLQCKPIVGILLIFFFTLLSATLRYIAMANNNLSLVLYHGISSKSLLKSANLTYTLPLHRVTPYMFGVGLGVLLRYTGKDVRIHKMLVILGWLIAMALGSWSLFSPWHLARRDYVYDVEEATNYAVITPVLWAVAMCWCIFACHTNNGGIINRFLSSHWLSMFSRISYAVYLTQFAVFFYNVGTTRYSTEFQLHTAIDPLEAATVVVVSIVLTLLFDVPMQEIKNVIMESTDSQTVGVPSKEKSESQGTEEEQKKPKDEAAGEKAFEEDEVALTGWDWQKDIVDGGSKLSNEAIEDEEQVNMPILKKSTGRRRSFMSHDSDNEPASQWDWVKEYGRGLSKDDDEYKERRGRSRSGQRDYRDESEALELSRMQQDREEAVKRSRRSVSRGLDSRRLSARDSDDEEEYSRRRDEEGEEDGRRYRRSESRGRSVIRESDDYRSWEFVGKERSSSRGPDSKRLPSKSEEYEPAQRQTRPSLSRPGDARRALSSESEEEFSQRKKAERRHPSAEPRISDEEDWESELRIRRKQFMEKLGAQQRDSSLAEEEGLSSPRRRSSAEGKIALLKDPSADDNMDSWTVSVGSRMAQLGSSQERSEPEEDNAYLRRREYREQAPPLREDTQSEEEVIWDAARRRSYTSSSQVTSVEEDEDVSSYNFVLTKDSKRISLQDLSKLAKDDSDLADTDWNVLRKEGSDALPKSTSLGLFKRESIIKSQASEEDPEYLLPERPKLVQQEREHPFKKAWQVQKSRSEEDGSAAYAMRDHKDHKEPKEAREQRAERSRHDDVRPAKMESSGEQYEDVGSFADDESESITLSRSSDTEEARTETRSSRSEETETASTERSESVSIEDNKGNSKSDTEEDSLRFNWPTEDEQFEVRETSQRRKSEETDWTWEQEET